MFQLDTEKYSQPVLVSGTDGVGTKLRIAMMMDRHDTIGIDAVAMCERHFGAGGNPSVFPGLFGHGKAGSSENR